MGVEPSTRCVHGNTLSIRPGALLDHCWGQVIYHQVEGGGVHTCTFGRGSEYVFDDLQGDRN